MGHTGIGLLVGVVIAMGMVSSAASASSPLGDRGFTLQAWSPTAEPRIPAPAGEPNGAPTRPSGPRRNTREWTGVTVTQSQPSITKEKNAMSGTPIPMPIDPALQKVVTQAKQALARRLAIPEEQIELVEVQSVIWPDKSLGCPQPGMVYIQIQVDGLLIRFRAGGQVYEYRSGGNRPPFLCENPTGASGRK